MCAAAPVGSRTARLTAAVTAAVRVLSLARSFAPQLISYVQSNKAADTDWFTLSPANKEGTKWVGKCWYVHNLLKYEFDLEFELPVTYPMTSPELQLPELDGKTAKMYRGGKICLTIHFKPVRVLAP
jgi:hypothetical protein